MKRLIQLSILILFYSTLVAQKVQVILQGNDSDTSFYHLTKINDNEFWIGGGHGMIKKIDSIGNITPLHFSTDNLNILKIEKVNNYIFILTDNAVIFRYDTQNNTFLKKEFVDFKNKCFYDVVPIENDKLMVCGGSSGISKGEKNIPHGFIAIVDIHLTSINTVWKSYRKFVWSLLTLDDGTVLAATFNGLNTRIIKSGNRTNWITDCKIKGLVHEIALFEKNVYYSGTQSIRYKENGIFGQKDKPATILKNTGCLWSMEITNDKIVAGSQSGHLQIIDKITSTIEQIKIPSSFSIYDIQKLSNSKIVMVGHGKSMCIVDLKK